MAPLEAEVDDLGLLVCDEDLELIAGEVDFHTKALKSAVTVRARPWRRVRVRVRCAERCALSWAARRPAQSRLVALKSKMASSVDALEAERRFIVARSITLQNQADSLKARARLAARRRLWLGTRRSC
jgi:hypothetical protein